MWGMQALALLLSQSSLCSKQNANSSNRHGRCGHCLKINPLNFKFSIFDSVSSVFYFGVVLQITFYYANNIFIIYFVNNIYRRKTVLISSEVTPEWTLDQLP